MREIDVVKNIIPSKIKVILIIFVVLKCIMVVFIAILVVVRVLHNIIYAKITQIHEY